MGNYSCYIGYMGFTGYIGYIENIEYIEYIQYLMNKYKLYIYVEYHIDEKTLITLNYYQQ